MKRSDWHFKLHKQAKTKTYFSLINCGNISECSYFWRTVGLCIFMFLAGIALSIAALCSLYVVLNTVLAFVFGGLFHKFDVKYIEYEVGLWVTIMTCFAVFIGAGRNLDNATIPKWMINLIPTKFKDAQLNDPKSLSFIGSYYKAYKSKFCPIVKLED